MKAVNERSLTALVLLVIGAALLSSTYGAQYADLGGAFSPMFYPRIILFIWVALTLLALATELMAREGTEAPNILRVVVLSLATLVFLYAMPRLGFFLSAVPFSLLALITLGLRSPLPILGVAVGVPAALVALFNHLLILPLPTSPVAWWF